MIGSIDFPAVNASLNALSGLLLLLGYWAIKRRFIWLHKVSMLAALVVSASFLVSYLYYHIVMKHGVPTEFGGPLPAKRLYLTILGTHTVLAMCLLVLAPRVAYFGLREQLLKHVRLARWVLPAWLYVSATGVVVYWMLYHLYPAE